MRRLLTLLLSLVPFVAKAKSVSGIASYYAESYEGRRMANGQKYSRSMPVVATYVYPLGTNVEITYISRNGQERKAFGIVCDRGPAKWVTASDPKRLFDLSPSLFKKLETLHRGIINVTVREVRK